jgi:hypothetical protein
MMFEAGWDSLITSVLCIGVVGSIAAVLYALAQFNPPSKIDGLLEHDRKQREAMGRADVV